MLGLYTDGVYIDIVFYCIVIINIFFSHCRNIRWSLAIIIQIQKHRSISIRSSLISGVVQGSVLGPLLFLLYVDDVVRLFSSGVLCNMYAEGHANYRI